MFQLRKAQAKKWKSSVNKLGQPKAYQKPEVNILQGDFNAKVDKGAVDNSVGHFGMLTK